MEMGTGKSKVIIDTVAYLYDAGRIDSVLIIAPKGMYKNWINNELPTHLPDHIVHRAAAWSSTMRKAEEEKVRSCLEAVDDLRIIVMNVEAFSSKKGGKFAELFCTCGGNVFMVVDESTTIKNPKAARTKSILKLGTYAKYKRILTGEPITRSPLDLYSQCQFLSPAILGFSSYYSFRNRYAIMVDMKTGMRSFKKVVGFQRLDELGGLIHDFSYRCKKDECLDLPDKIYQYRTVELTKEQKDLYNNLSNAAMTLYKSQSLTVDNALTLMLRLHQITCGHFVSDDGEVSSIPDNRLAELEHVLEEAPDKVIIWATYVNDIKRICSLIGEKYGLDSYVPYYGAVSQDDRETALTRFQNEEACRFFIGNPQTGGMGLTLTAANTVVYYSNNFNLEHRIQSEDRAHRIGQNRSVLYVDLICPGTIDSKVVKSLRDKKQVAQQIMGDKIQDWLGSVRSATSP